MLAPNAFTEALAEQISQQCGTDTHPDYVRGFVEATERAAAIVRGGGDALRVELEHAWLDGATAGWEFSSPVRCAQAPTFFYPLPRRVKIKNPFRVRGARR